MAEDTPATPEEPVVTEQSLDDVIAEYNVQPVETPAVVEQPSTPETPSKVPTTVDPLDATQFNAYVEQVNTGQSVLTNQLQEMQTELTNYRQERAASQVDADIKQAVTKVNEGLDLDPRIVRTHLEIAAQEKPGFKKIWDNREQNPAAFEKALGALSREVGSLYEVKQDPALTENHKAVQQSQQSMAGRSSTDVSSNPIEATLADTKTEAERAAAWQRITSG